MDCTLNETQQAVRENFERFFENESPPARVRAAEPLGFDSGLWALLAGTGVVAMGVPEDEGGSGAGLAELVFVAREYGKRLAPVPLVESVVAARLLAQFEPARSADWYDQLLAGEKIATLALRPAEHGGMRLVPAGAVADLVVALDGDRLLVSPIAGDPPRTSPENLGSQPLADCTLDSDALLLASGDQALAAYEIALAEWKLLTAAALVGLSEQAHAIALDYVKIRKAFGIMIGSFQSVAHRIADDGVLIDGSYLLCLEAAWAADEKLRDAARLCSMAFIHAAETAGKTAGDALHLHGGIGFTMEGDIQLYFRRAKAWALVYADPRQELQRLAHLVIEASEEEAR
ncbi:MAG: acyl-CoA/acyl-ACP dehydrogenase, partial [Actinobacteria bacterium]|nr:acyl-CoA/acyl-ACP dehydrogenase [Actinomycetota bacterium]